MRIGRRTAVAAAVALVACRRPSALLCFAAASTAEALREACAGLDVRFSFAGSGDLARQIESGARPDVFLSADESKMDALEAKGLVRKEERRDLLGNRLVVVAAEGVKAPSTAKELVSMGYRVAIGDPKLVPAGSYARAWLEREGVWSALSSKVVPCADVRAALAAVDSGAVAAAVVYRTDVAAARRAKLAFEPAEQPRIVYPVAALSPRGKALVDHLASPASRAVFDKHGFSSPPA